MDQISHQAQFCRDWSERRIEELLRFSYAELAISQLGWTLFTLFVVPGLTGKIVWIFNFAMLVLAAAAYLQPRYLLRKYAMCAIVMIIEAFFLGMCAYVSRYDATVGNLLMTSTSAVVYAIFGIICFPGPIRVLAAWVVVLVGGAWAAFSSLHGGLVWSVIYVLAIPIAFFLRCAAGHLSRQNAEREYRFLTTIAPSHFARHAVGSMKELHAVFAPRERLCVCLSSDWRNYQQISSNLSPEALGQALNAYYDTCQELLVRHLPNGNYYTDWIADEFFIVLYPEEPETGVETAIGIVDQAIRFAQELIVEKQRFTDQYGLPKAVDIGVSYGVALLGLMGPMGHKKATALGVVPGRARRLQSAGKMLRHKLGEGDRVIFGQDCLMQLRQGYDVQTLQVSAADQLRDLDDAAIFYLDPVALPVLKSA